MDYDRSVYKASAMTQDGFFINDNVNSGAGEYNSLLFAITQVLGRVNTATLVQVISVTNLGDVQTAGTVNVQPLVNQVDGAGNATPHGILYSLPYLRIQGGGDAFIIDPKVGDIGIAIFADHDITNVVDTQTQSNPFSARRFSMADGLYLGGILNGPPNQYVEFSSAGIKIHSPTAIIIDAPDIQLTSATLEINATGAASLNAASLSLNAPAITSSGVWIHNGNMTTNGALVNNGKNIGPSHVHLVTGVGSNTTGVV